MSNLSDRGPGYTDFNPRQLHLPVHSRGRFSCYLPHWSSFKLQIQILTHTKFISHALSMVTELLISPQSQPFSVYITEKLLGSPTWNRVW